MKLTYLGHAGFCVETAHAIVIMDPWLSPEGAFDSSWFQLPKNHDLAPVVDDKLGLPKEKFVYVSHEHEDHYDRRFLDSLQNRDFTLVIARFRRPGLRRALAQYECKQIISVSDRESVPFDGGELKLFLDDSELNRDSAMLVRAEGETFLNLNDCRIFDRMTEISQEEGQITAFTCQFSGASWHPTCYEYSSEDFERISKQKVLAKFRMVERAIEVLRPQVFIPSAGPVCFLAPELVDLNFRSKGIFRRAPEVVAYLTPAMQRAGTRVSELLPGDTLDLHTKETEQASGARYRDEDFEEYVAAYAAEYDGYFAKRRSVEALIDAKGTFMRLQSELQKKVDLLVLRDRVSVPLYFGLQELSGEWLRVDFSHGNVERRAEIAEPAHYRILANAWQIAKVLDGEMTWEDFALSFRVRLKRVPDEYQALIHAFLVLGKGDLYRFCRMIIDLENRTERVEVEAGGKKYLVDRYCPHNGGDLQEGWLEGDRYLVCSRHGWCFDLQNAGACTTNSSSIHAEAVAPEKPVVLTSA